MNLYKKENTNNTNHEYPSRKTDHQSDWKKKDQKEDPVYETRRKVHEIVDGKGETDFENRS